MINKPFEVQWISVNDRLPEIPEGNYGVSVLIAEFDHTFERISPGRGYTIQDVSYGYTDRLDQEWGKIPDKYFMTTASSEEHGYIWVPCMDEVTHWMYLPEPPIYETTNE